MTVYGSAEIVVTFYLDISTNEGVPHVRKKLKEAKHFIEHQLRLLEDSFFVDEVDLETETKNNGITWIAE